MTKFTVYNQDSGVVFGVYEGETETEAFTAWAKDAGYNTDAAIPTGIDGVVIEEGVLPGVTVAGGEGEDWDVGVVQDPDFGDPVPHADDAVWVSWKSGVSTWTPVSELKDEMGSPL